MNHAELVARNKASNLASWTSQADWNPISMVKGEGIYFWDADDKRFIDWSSMLVNVNIGHGHPHVIQAIQEQAAKMTYAYPGIATEERARLAEMLAEIAPQGLKKTFFTLGGADAIENAMKLARLSTGRQKILARYRAFHGAGFGAMTAGGDPRRLANEPGVPWIVHVHDPYAYRSPIYRGRTREEGDTVVADLIEDTIQFEGPENVAGILLESYSGTSGVLQGGEVFWKRIQEIAERYSILIILDEVMSGFGRTGKWFGIDHYPFVKPDLVVMAKGITSGYVPLGAVMASEQVSAYFDNHVLWGGLTYSAHALACAVGVANLEVYKNEKLIENSAKMGKVMRAQLMDLAEQHPCVGDVRGTGLLQVIEIVKNRETREPMSAFNKPLTPPMAAVAASLRQQGMSTFVRWNLIFCCPPLVIREDQVKEGVDIIDRALAATDKAYEGT